MTPIQIKFLTGTPISSQLDWSEDRLLTSFTTTFELFLGRQITQPIASTPAPTSSTIPAAWREISLNGALFYETPLPPRHTRHTTHFYTPAREADDADFLEHSFFALDNLQSSQLAPAQSAADGDGDGDGETTFATSTSFATTELSTEDTSFLSHSTAEEKATAVAVMPKGALTITAIRALPSAAHLLALRPQTMTVTLVVGVISVSAARSVTVRRGNYSMDVVEMMVGDETGAGFSVSSWLVPEDADHQSKSRGKGKEGGDPLRQTLRGLRSGDVLLVDRLALNSFRNQVFGQTLNRRATGNVTRFIKLDADVIDGLGAQLEAKVRRVQDWVDSFVVGGGKKRTLEVAGGSRVKRAKNGRVEAREDEEELPPDSP